MRRGRCARRLALWRGPPLAEFASDSFASVEIARLEELRLSAVEERIEADLATGRSAELVAELESLVASASAARTAAGQLMLALYRCGRQAEALQVYQDTRRLLVDELGIEPSQRCNVSNRRSCARRSRSSRRSQADREP